MAEPNRKPTEREAAPQPACFDRFRTIAFIGLGLIASSMSLALRRAGFDGRIVGTARTEATRLRALELGLIDEAFASSADACRDADLVVLCVPVGACGAVAREIAPVVGDRTVITDVGSVKESVINAVVPELPNPGLFVPAHPIAGTEKSGPDAGFAELFDRKWCLITPTEQTDADAMQAVAELWMALGSDIDTLAPDHHDLVLAITSHLPHLIAFNIVNAAAHLGEVTNSDVIKYSAGGFRDFTRIGASDPVMWRDVFLNNRDATLEMLGRFEEDLTELRRAIRYGDGAVLEKRFAEARTVRRGIIDAGQDVDTADFGRGLARRVSDEDSAPSGEQAGGEADG